MQKKDFIPALGYDWLTGFYDLTIKATMPEETFRRLLIDLLEPRPKERILDFGYGTGEVSLRAIKAEPGIELIGLDIDPKVREIALHKARSKGLNVRFDLYQGHAFPYPDNYFDKAVSSLVFHQLDKEQKELALSELYRVLKPGGTLLIGDWGKPKQKIVRLAFYTVQLLDGFKTTTDNVNGMMPDYISRAGFDEVREVASLNTAIGAYCYYQSKKP